jgi:CelD/BcsL family acetyltransferase involved in cellulose biosynthesis
MSDTAITIDQRVADRRSESPDGSVAAHPAIDLAIHHGLDSVEADWRQFEPSADCGVFQTFDWLAAWCRHVGPLMGTQPAVVVGRRADGAVLFILPLAVTGGALRRLSWLGSELCDYNGPIVARDFAAQLTPARFHDLWWTIRSRLQSDPKTRFDLVELTKMPERIGTQANPMLALSAMPNPSNAYVTNLFGTWDAFYLEKRSSATRRRDRSKLKRLNEFGAVRFVTPQDQDEIARTIATLMEQKARSFARMGVSNIFARPGWSAFFADVARNPQTRDLVHVSRLDIGPNWAAINLGLVYRESYYHVLASHDDGEPSRYGPGVAHLRELMRFAIERGLKHFDFTIGDERYKSEWSDRTVALYDHVAAASARGWVAVAVIRAGGRVKRFIKQNQALWSLFSRARAALGGKSSAPEAEEPHRRAS